MSISIHLWLNVYDLCIPARLCLAWQAGLRESACPVGSANRTGVSQFTSVLFKYFYTCPLASICGEY